MRKGILSIACLACVTLAGCGGPASKKAYMFYGGAEKATIEALTVMQRAGDFTPEETREIDNLIERAEFYRKHWRAALDANVAPGDMAINFKKVIDELIEIQIQKEQEKAGEK